MQLSAENGLNEGDFEQMTDKLADLSKVEPKRLVMAKVSVSANNHIFSFVLRPPFRPAHMSNSYVSDF